MIKHILTTKGIPWGTWSPEISVLDWSGYTCISAHPSLQGVASLGEFSRSVACPLQAIFARTWSSLVLFWDFVTCSSAGAQVSRCWQMDSLHFTRCQVFPREHNKQISNAWVWTGGKTWRTRLLCLKSGFMFRLLEGKIYADILGDSGPHKSEEEISSSEARFVICECPNFVLLCHGFLPYQLCSRKEI